VLAYPRQQLIEIAAMVFQWYCQLNDIQTAQPEDGEKESGVTVSTETAAFAAFFDAGQCVHCRKVLLILLVVMPCVMKCAQEENDVPAFA